MVKKKKFFPAESNCTALLQCWMLQLNGQHFCLYPVLIWATEWLSHGPTRQTEFPNAFSFKYLNRHSSKEINVFVLILLPVKTSPLTVYSYSFRMNINENLVFSYFPQTHCINCHNENFTTSSTTCIDEGKERNFWHLALLYFSFTAHPPLFQNLGNAEQAKN